MATKPRDGRAHGRGEHVPRAGASWPRWRRRSTTSAAGGPMLGIGAAWFETEHRAFGLPFGSGPPERLRWLGEALPVMRGMLDGEAAHGRGGALPRRGGAQRSAARSSAGCRSSSGAAASRSRSSSSPGTPTRTTSAAASRTSSARTRSCAGTARPSGATKREIERTTGTRHGRHPRLAGGGAARAGRDRSRRNGRASLWEDQPVGHAGGRRRRCSRRTPTIGYRHLIAGFPSPYDEESMTRLITEVQPKLADG